MSHRTWHHENVNLWSFVSWRIKPDARVRVWSILSRKRILLFLNAHCSSGPVTVVKLFQNICCKTAIIVPLVEDSRCLVQVLNPASSGLVLETGGEFRGIIIAVILFNWTESWNGARNKKNSTEETYLFNCSSKVQKYNTLLYLKQNNFN